MNNMLSIKTRAYEKNTNLHFSELNACSQYPYVEFRNTLLWDFSMPCADMMSGAHKLALEVRTTERTHRFAIGPMRERALRFVEGAGVLVFSGRVTQNWDG